MGNYYLYKIAEFLTRILPLKISYLVAVLLSDCQYFLSAADRSSVADNLKTITGAPSVPSSMVRAVFHNFGKYLIDFFTMTHRVNKDYIKNSVHIEGMEHLNHVLKEGKGGILLSAHLGNWELAGSVISLLGYPLSVVALSHRDDKVNTYFNRQREFFGTKVIQTNVAIRRCLQDLKANRLIAILGDRDFGHHGIPMSFFGKKALIPKGAALFSIKTGAPIIPGFFLRADKNKFQFAFQQPIYPPVIKDEKNISEKVLEDYIQQYLHIMENQIRQNPSQWLMFRRFNIE